MSKWNSSGGQWRGNRRQHGPRRRSLRGPLALINPMLGGKYVVMCVREATHSRAIGYRFIGLTARYTFSLPLSASLNGGKS
jgi:hypothetical protein